jgi:hypothetical protein
VTDIDSNPTAAYIILKERCERRFALASFAVNACAASPSGYYIFAEYGLGITLLICCGQTIAPEGEAGLKRIDVINRASRFDQTQNLQNRSGPARDRRESAPGRFIACSQDALAQSLCQCN